MTPIEQAIQDFRDARRRFNEALDAFNLANRALDKAEKERNGRQVALSNAIQAAVEEAP